MSFGDIYWKTLKFLLKSCSCHYFKDILRSKTTFTKGVCIMTQIRANLSKKSSMSNLSAILCAKLLAWKCMPNFKIMVDNQSCHIWHSVKACFCITLFMLRSMQVTVSTSSFTLIVKEISSMLLFLTYVPCNLCSLCRFFCLWWPDYVAIYCTAPATNHIGKLKGGNTCIYWTQTVVEIFWNFTLCFLSLVVTDSLYEKLATTCFKSAGQFVVHRYRRCL